LSVKRGSQSPGERRKDPCHETKTVHQDFKRPVVEQLLSETASPAELCRRYNIASGQLYTWKKQYADGKLDPEPSREADLEARVRELERLLGKVTLEN
jgi:transposase-like protein